MGLDGHPAWPKPCHPIWLQNHRKWSQLLDQMEHILGLSCPWRSTAVLCVLRLVEAWPHASLFIHFGALPARGAYWAPVWVKSGPSLAKGSTKTTASGEKGHLARTMLFNRFSCCLDGLWQALAARGCLWKLHRRLRTPLCQYRGTRVQLGSMETVGNERERMEMDANKPKIKPDQRSKSI